SSPCKPLRDRGIVVSVLYIPYQPINPVNASFAGDEDDYANWNIPNIPASLQDCASPPDAGGSYFYTANTPAEINAALQAMFNHSLQTAHITN
ncbi:MAG: pilus assembly protein, partial [Bradyrhizobium sp.]